MVNDVVIAGLVPNTSEPEPVSSLIMPASSLELVEANTFSLLPVNTKVPLAPDSSVIAAAKLALLGVAKKVATLVPNPLTPVLIGRPVALVNVMLVGVPSAPPS